MAKKPVYRVTINDVLPKGDITRTKKWIIYVGGERVGKMSSRITMSWWNPTNYNVYVEASVNGECVFTGHSRGFVTTMADARWERTRFTDGAKEAVTRQLTTNQKD